MQTARTVRKRGGERVLRGAVSLGASAQIAVDEILTVQEGLGGIHRRDTCEDVRVWRRAREANTTCGEDLFDSGDGRGRWANESVDALVRQILPVLVGARV